MRKWNVASIVAGRVNMNFSACAAYGNKREARIDGSLGRMKLLRVCDVKTVTLEQRFRVRALGDFPRSCKLHSICIAITCNPRGDIHSTVMNHIGYIMVLRHPFHAFQELRAMLRSVLVWDPANSLYGWRVDRRYCQFLVQCEDSRYPGVYFDNHTKLDADFTDSMSFSRSPVWIVSGLDRHPTEALMARMAAAALGIRCPVYCCIVIGCEGICYEEPFSCLDHNDGRVGAKKDVDVGAKFGPGLRRSEY